MKKLKAFTLALIVMSASTTGYIYIKNHSNVISNTKQSIVLSKSLNKVFKQLKKGEAQLSIPEDVTESDIKKIIDLYQLDLLSNPIDKFEITDDVLSVTYKFTEQEFKEMKKEANKILDEFINSIMSYSKEKQLFEIYSFVSKSMTYDINASHAPIESFLVEKVGDSNSFAVLFDTCLSLMNIEKYYAWDLSSDHIWNIAYLNGEPYHFDTTYEAAGYQGLFFTNFAMNDNRRVESSYITDWVVGYSKDFLINKPICIDDQYDFLYDSYGTVLMSRDDCLYYIDTLDDSKLKNFNFSTRDHNTVDASSVILLREYKDALYYIDNNFRVYIFDTVSQKLYPLGEDNLGYGFQEENGVFYLITLDDELKPIS